MPLEKLLQIMVLLVILLLTIKVVPIFLVVSSVQLLFHAVDYLFEETQRCLLPDQEVQDLVQNRAQLLLAADDLLGPLLADYRDQA